VFHVEMRQFPHVARAFNLTEEQLHNQFVDRWVRDQMIVLDDRRWAPERAKLKVYEGPQLASHELGLGRGWSNAARTGHDVTERVLSAARAGLRTDGGGALERPTGSLETPAGRRPSADGAPSGVGELKQRLKAELAAGDLALSRVPVLAGERALGLRASERLALAEQAVWELLQERRAGLRDARGPVAADRWEGIVLAWGSWAGGSEQISLVAPD
jgi:hypothetical protein